MCGNSSGAFILTRNGTASAKRLHHAHKTERSSFSLNDPVLAPRLPSATKTNPSTLMALTLLQDIESLFDSSSSLRYLISRPDTTAHLCAIHYFPDSLTATLTEYILPPLSTLRRHPYYWMHE